MTGSRFRLEVFELPEVTGDQVHLSASDLEETRLAAFEKGYTAGWDDAAASQENEAARQRAELARNLQDLSFTYHEARTHILRAMEPLLRDMVTKVLPVIARQTIGEVALEALRPLAEEISASEVTVVVNAETRPTVESLLRATDTIPIRFEEEPSLGPGQVYLRMGDTESRVDLDGVIAAIGAAITAFFDSQKEEKDD